MKKQKRSLLSALLILSLLLSGCSISTFSDKREHLESLLYPTTQGPDSGKPDSHKPGSHKPSSGKPDSQQPGEDKPQDSSSDRDFGTYVPYADFEREYDPYLEQIPFSDIEYVSPDSEPIIKGYEALQTTVEAGTATADEIIAAYEEVFEEHLFFDTMHTLSYIRYSLDLSDTYYDEEYNRCEELSPLINQAQEKCYVAMSESPLRKELEESYFGEDFFLFYDKNRVYSKDSVVALMQKESELEAQYMALQDNPTVLWKGEETSLDELLTEYTLSYDDYLQVYNLYYSKYAPLSADLFAQLIRVRKEIAKELGYDSYADFAYSYLYERDYTPEQVSAYCDDIADEMPSLLFTAYLTQMDTYNDIETVQCVALFEEVVESFGGVIKTAYEFMVDYELWDISVSSSKLPGSYMTYLNSYEMPFVYVSPNGSMDDLMTLCHEFGHFVDGYVNCGGFSGVDCAEVFSQGLEFLALSRADLNPALRSSLTASKAADSVMVFLSQACYAEFEARAYDLPDEELTVEGLNRLYEKVNKKYGISMLYTGMEELLAPGWIDIQHFFIAPYYVISYCVSNDTALQIYQRELQEGDGLDLYYDMLCQPRDSSLLELTGETGLVSPFDPGRIEELADFLDDQLN